MDSFWLCEDCLFAVAYDDFTALSLADNETQADRRCAAVQAGLAVLAPLSADFDREAGWGIKAFSLDPCEACGRALHGPRYRFVRL